MVDYLEPFRDVISGPQSKVQKHAVMWCVENLIPLRQWQKYSMREKPPPMLGGAFRGVQMGSVNL